MALNPFFLQGSKGEQTLLQELSNEQIRMHGIEFIYMPRVLVKSASVLREITSSSFDRSFPIEGYISSYEGFDAGYNLLTKFGVRSTAEMKIIISSDRYENSISPLLWKFPSATVGPTGRAQDQTRPFEGDLMYFPLRDIIFEIKYPEITKKISTPTNPPLNDLKSAWKRITGITARARTHQFQHDISK